MRFLPHKRHFNKIDHNCFKWDNDYGMYTLHTHKTVIDTAMVQNDDVYRYLAGETLHIFPQYDKTKHTIDRFLTNLEGTTFTSQSVVFFKLNEITPPENKGLPYGIFRCKHTYSETGICPMTFSSDEYIEIGQEFDICQDFLNFKNSIISATRRKKKAVLLYGPPGNGKTASISKLAKIAEKEKFRVFFLDNEFPLNELKKYRDILNDETAVFVIEELTQRLDKNVEEVLSFLDGQTSWDNSYIIATTNHPEDLPLNIIDRPGRFKEIHEIKNPTQSQREIYFRVMGMPESQILDAALATDGLSFDYVKSILLDSQANNQPIKELVVEYNERRHLISKNFKQKLGI